MVLRLGRVIAMEISSRTPGGQPNNCPICRHDVVMEPSQPFGDAPCPYCGCLLRFEPFKEGFRVALAEAAFAEFDLDTFKKHFSDRLKEFDDKIRAWHFLNRAPRR